MLRMLQARVGARPSAGGEQHNCREKRRSKPQAWTEALLERGHRLPGGTLGTFFIHDDSTEEEGTHYRCEQPHHIHSDSFQFIEMNANSRHKHRATLMLDVFYTDHQETLRKETHLMGPMQEGLKELGKISSRPSTALDTSRKKNLTAMRISHRGRVLAAAGKLTLTSVAVTDSEM